VLGQMKTQTQSYWQDEFAVTQEDIEFIYSLLIETGTPLLSDEIARALIEERVEKEINQIRLNLKRGRIYQPRDEYKVGDGIVFPALDGKFGVVVAERPGYNPEYGDFTVIQVQIEGENKAREFASRLTAPHKQNRGDSADAILASLSNASSDEIFALYGRLIQQKVEQALFSSDNLDFVRFGKAWYLKGLLADVHIGHRNIVEAVLDVNGAPLGPEELLRQIDLPPDIPAEARLFSLNYALEHDERFVDVGADDRVLWFLRRLEPAEAQQPPHRLIPTSPTYDRSVLTREMLLLEKELDDEWSEVEWPRSELADVSSVSFTLTYPHYRAGTIPLTQRIQQLFPKGSTQHTRVTLIDGQSGNHIPAWVVHPHRYVYGLEHWYRANRILAGSYLTLEKTDDPFTVIINFRPKREKREWIRAASADGNQLRFEMRKEACRCEYDDLMVIGEDNREKIDALWLRLTEEQVPFEPIVHQVFLELAKLSPQGTVHAKTLYAAVNVARRCPPGPIFAVLATNAQFSEVGDGYWLFNKPEGV